MIAKKNSRYDLERKRIVFFQIGLFAMGAFTLAAFTYKTPIENDTRKREVAFQHVVMIEEEVTEIPKKDDPIVRELPQPPSTTDPTVAADPVVSEFIDPTTSTSTDPTTGVTVGTGNLIPGDETNLGGIVDVEAEIVEIPDVEAKYIGGYAAMVEFINDNIQFPQDAIDMNVQGKVFLSFVIERDGSISNIKVERGVFKSIDREATRIVRSFPTWIPGESKAQKVRTRVRLPINFTFE